MSDVDKLIETLDNLLSKRCSSSEDGIASYNINRSFNVPPDRRWSMSMRHDGCSGTVAFGPTLEELLHATLENEYHQLQEHGEQLASELAETNETLTALRNIIGEPN